jgi:hypothetical protein
MDDAFAKVNHVVREGGDGMELEAVPLALVPGAPEHEEQVQRRRV